MKAGRLAFREEGEFWNAYFADVDTMEGAIFLGSIRLGMIRKYPSIRDQFVDLMKEIFSEACRDAVGAAPDYWDEIPAPEHERARE